MERKNENQWISLDVELPPEGQRVIMTDGNREYTASLNTLSHHPDDPGGHWIPANYGSGARVTHWRGKE